MAAEENRIANLRHVVDAEAQEAGGKIRLGYRAVATRSGLDEEYVYQLYKGVKKSMGANAAKTLARAYANGRPLSWIDESPSDSMASDDIIFTQYTAVGSMGRGLTLEEQPPGIIKSWNVSPEWVRLNVPYYTAAKNLCIVTGFGPSMRPLYNPGDPLLMDRGVTKVDQEGVFFFRLGEMGFIKQIQRIPSEAGLLLRAKSLNPTYDSFDITPKMQDDFECFGKILTVWKSEQV